jgi:acyl carrier protein
MSPLLIQDTVVQSAVVRAIASLARRPAGDIRLSDRLVEDLGLDSANTVNLLFEIETELNLPLPDGYENSLLDVTTVQELVDRLRGIVRDNV